MSVKLFLEAYTETQIADRTGHSYESIENYIKEFGTVMILSEQGMSVPMILKVTGRSTRLIQLFPAIQYGRKVSPCFKTTSLSGYFILDLISSGSPYVQKQLSSVTL